MLWQSHSSRADKEDNLKVQKSLCSESVDNFWIKENTRLIQNEIKLLKEISFLREKFFHYEDYQANKINNFTQTQINHQYIDYIQSDQSIMSTISTSVSIIYAGLNKQIESFKLRFTI